MQQTEKYHFIIIEDTDTFSPDALNGNARTAEAQLAALEKADAALASTHATDKAALEKTAANNKTALEQSIASTRTALEQNITNTKTTLEKSISSQKTTLDAADAAIRTAMGSGGKTCRIETGSYVGNGQVGKNYPNSITFHIKPHIVFVVSASHSDRFQLLMRPRDGSFSDTSSSYTTVTWAASSVSWYISGSTAASYQANVSGTTYYWIALGESL